MPQQWRMGVAVQLGEGTKDIIYGETSVPAGPRTFGGYLSRPDGLGEWPTVLIFGPMSKRDWRKGVA